MLGFLFKSPAAQLIAQSDWMTKLVLLTLFIMSVTAVAIILFKFKTLKQQKIDLNNLFLDLKKINNFDDLIQVGEKHRHTSSRKFLEENLKDLKEIISHKNDKKINDRDLEYLELSSDQHIDQLLIESENYLPILGTSAAVSPLMGLFGTVWGLIHSFVNISQEKSADIAVVAPGIAEALTTTLAGLIVAIPAMIAFNYFSNELRKQEQVLSHISDRYLNIVKQSYLK